jgi:putative inorganic carbon (HCO3(-)) transporter
MILRSEIIYVALCALILGAGFILARNKMRFLLAAGVFTIALQGGYWIGFLSLDFTISYFIFVVLLVWNFIEPQGGNQLKGALPAPVYFWLGVILFCFLAVMPAVNKNKALMGVAYTILDLMVVFAVLKSLRKPTDIKLFLGSLIAAMILQGALAVIQYKYPWFKVGVIDKVQSYMWWRTKGTFYHANEMGMYMLLMIPVVLRVFLDAFMKRDRKWMKFAGIALLLGGIGLFGTASRGSWFGLTAGCLFMFGIDFFKSGKANKKVKRILQRLMVPAMLLLIVFSIKFGPRLMERLFYTNADDMVKGRIEYQEEAKEIIKQNPVFGVGYKNYLYHTDKFFVHNLYLLVASEIGIPGLIFLAGFLVSFFVLTIKGIQSKVLYVSNMSRGIFASLIGFLIASIPGPDFWISGRIQIFFWMVVALQISLLRLEKVALAQGELKLKMSPNIRSQAANKSEISGLEPVSESDTQQPFRNIRTKGF